MMLHISDHVYVDTCAITSLCILSYLVYFLSVEKIDGAIGLRAAGATTKKLVLAPNGVTLCKIARRTIISKHRLQSLGYGL